MESNPSLIDFAAGDALYGGRAAQIKYQNRINDKWKWALGLEMMDYIGIDNPFDLPGRSSLCLPAIAARIDYNWKTGMVALGVNTPSLFNLVVQDRNFRRLLSRIGVTSSNNGLAPVSYSKSDELSLREKQVIRLIADGLQNKEVADKLNISTVTVKSHLTHIYRKLEVPNRTSMLRLARDRRILK